LDSQEYLTAAEFFIQASILNRDIGNWEGLADALRNLGQVSSRLGDHKHAAAAATAASGEAPGSARRFKAYVLLRRSMALSASWIAACAMAKMRDCSTGFLPAAGAALVAIAFQSVTTSARLMAAGPMMPMITDRSLSATPGRLRRIPRRESRENVFALANDSLVQCLIDVRRALGDDGQRYVKTIPRQGYLFDAPVSEPASSTSDAADKVDAVSDSAPGRWRSKPAILSAALISALVLAGLVAALVWRSSRPRPAKTVAEVSSIAVLPFKSIAGLADAYNMTGLFVFTFSPPREIYPKAKEAAREALGIDGDLGEAHTSLAYAKLNYDWDWPEVERVYQRAIELKPDDGNLQHWYSHYRMTGGRTEESLAASRRALALDPLDLTFNAHLGWHYLYAREYEQAAEQLLKTIELDPNYVTARLYLGFVYEQQGMNEAAIAEFGKAAALSGEGRRPVMEAALGQAYAVAGKKAEARRALDGLKAAAERRYISPYSIAVLYLGLGDKEQAFAWLDQAYEERDNWLIYLKMEPRLDPLRSDARFADLPRRVGLAP
jgi:tetratricopeptide (TPR) repeat protein